MAGPSDYYDFEHIARAVADGRHRDVVGGLWGEIGRLQFEFLVSQGLLPDHRLVDVGCGCLRGGIHLVRYLEPGNYFGIDINQPLLDAGYDFELSQGLRKRLPRAQLRCDGEFDFSPFHASFDFAIAQSLFTHLPADLFRLCLERLARSIAPGGRFYASFYIAPDAHALGVQFCHPGGWITADHCEPYHYRLSDIVRLCASLPWHPSLIGEWAHPRGLQMVLFQHVGRP
jgi:SAM-dependent methyltransferase